VAVGERSLSDISETISLFRRLMDQRSFNSQIFIEIILDSTEPTPPFLTFELVITEVMSRNTNKGHVSFT